MRALADGELVIDGTPPALRGDACGEWLRHLLLKPNATPATDRRFGRRTAVRRTWRQRQPYRHLRESAIQKSSGSVDQSDGPASLLSISVTAQYASAQTYLVLTYSCTILQLTVPLKKTAKALFGYCSSRYPRMTG
jgi:hypothetical protein